MVFRCPKCNRPLGRVGDDGTLETTCAGCHFRFRIWQGRLATRLSHQITLREPHPDQQGAYRRAYEFHLAMPGGRTETVTFEIPGRDDPIPFRENDTLAVAWSLRGGSVEELLYVMDRTVGRTYHLAAPGESARNRAIAVGVVVFVSAFALTCAGSEENVGLALLVAGALGAGSGIAVGLRSQPKHILPPETEAAVAMAQSLLSRREELARARMEVQDDLRLKEATIGKLRALAEKMQATDPTLYAHRLDVMRRGITSIESQLDVERQLIDAHSRLIAILEIEAESASASVELEGGTAAAIDQRLEEVRALREASEELERQLRSNDEVERYLQAGSPEST